jgi:hypothetical protein
MELLTLREAAHRLHCCEEIAKQVLYDHRVPFGARFRYPARAIAMILRRGFTLRGRPDLAPRREATL